MKKMWLKVVSMLTALTMLFVFTPAADVATSSKVSASSMVEDITKDVINSYTKDLSKLIGNVPYVGTILESIFDICSDAFYDEFYSWFKPDSQKSDPLSEIQEDLADIKTSLTNLTVSQELSKNNTFNEYATILYSKCRAVFDSDEISDSAQGIVVENKAEVMKNLNELEELSKQGYADDSEEIQNKIKELETNREKVSNSIDDLKEEFYTQDFKTDINYIETILQGKGIGQEDNPFIVYLNAKNVELKFGNDALKATHEYQESVLKVYVMSHSLQNEILENEQYKINKQLTQIDILEKKKDKSEEEKEKLKSLKNKERTLKKELEKIDKKLTSSTTTMKNILKTYETTLKEEEKSVEKYYFDNNNSITIHGIAQAKVEDGNLDTVGNNSQPDMLRKYSLIAKNNEKFNKYVQDFCMMIAENIDTSKQTLREFLNSKGFKVPEKSKYLMVGKCKQKNDLTGGGKLCNYLLVAKLDETVNIKNIQIKDIDRKTILPEELIYSYSPYELSGIGGYASRGPSGKYFYINTNELCYFTEEDANTDPTVASVQFKNFNRNKVEYFDDFEDAWNYTIEMLDIHRDSEPKFTLYKDWIAKETPGKTTSSFGTGRGFHKNGAICPDGKEGSKIWGKVTIDLNGHKIDRNLTNGATTPSSSQDKAAVDDGSVIIAEYVSLKLISTTGTGLITGGNTTGQGGGLCIRSWLEMEDCDVKGNFARGNGGGVYLSWHDKVVWSQPTGTFINVNITNNYTRGQGGGVATETASTYTSDIAISCKVVIDNNGKCTSGYSTSQNDCFMRENFVAKNIFYIKNYLWAGTKIGVISNTTDKILRITDSTKKGDYSNLFFYNNSNYRIEHYTGSWWNSDKHYLRIRKN